MAKRSSVGVLATAPCNSPTDESESCSVNVRKIDNGYITSESRCKGNEYSHTETFSKNKPEIQNMGRRPAADAGKGSMRDALKELRRR